MIGFRVLTLLLEAGYKVRAAVRNQAGFDRISKLKPVAPYASDLTSIVVPDITVPGAYDEAVKGVEYIVHVASPLASNAPPGIDYDSYMIHPAIQGTVGILESAVKTTGIKRVVITGSILSIVTPQVLGSGQYVNGELFSRVYSIFIALVLIFGQRKHVLRQFMVHSQIFLTLMERLSLQRLTRRKSSLLRESRPSISFTSSLSSSSDAMRLSQMPNRLSRAPTTC